MSANGRSKHARRLRVRVELDRDPGSGGQARVTRDEGNLKRLGECDEHGVVGREVVTQGPDSVGERLVAVDAGEPPAEHVVLFDDMRRQRRLRGEVEDFAGSIKRLAPAPTCQGLGAAML